MRRFSLLAVTGLRNSGGKSSRGTGVSLFPFLQTGPPSRLQTSIVPSPTLIYKLGYAPPSSPSSSSSLSLPRSYFSTISSRNKKDSTSNNAQQGKGEVELLQKAEKLMEEARRLFERRDVEGTIERCSKVIEMAPSRLVSPYYLRAECWQRQRPQPRYDRALSDYRRILEVFPEDPLLSLLGIAKCLSLQGDLEGAVLTYDKVLHLDPTFLPAIADRAETLRAQRRFPAALSAFERLHQLSLATEGKRNPDLMRGGGEEEEKVEKERTGSGVLGHYEEKGLLGKAAVLLQMNEQEGAYEIYQELLKKEPQCSAAYCGVGLIHFHNNDLLSAIENYDLALRFSPHPQPAVIYHQRACALLDKQDFAKALADCHAALRLDPELNEGGGVQLTIAQCHEGLQNWEEAIQAFSTYINLHTSSSSPGSARPGLHFLALISVHLHRAHCRRNLFSSSSSFSDLVSPTFANLYFSNQQGQQLEDLLRDLRYVCHAPPCQLVHLSLSFWVSLGNGKRCCRKG
jgi:tetratricopeptide (TPR) repeat protein